MKQAIITLILLTVVYSDESLSCDYSLSGNGNKAQTRFINNGSTFFCGAIGTENEIYFEIISPLSKEATIVTIPNSTLENNFSILDIDSRSELAIVQTSKNEQATKKSEVSNIKVSRLFLVNLKNGELRNVTPALPKTCEVSEPKFVLGNSAMVYATLGAIRTYDEARGEWLISGCGSKGGLYRQDFAGGAAQRLSKASLNMASAISPSGKTIAYLAPEVSTSEYQKTLITRLDEADLTYDLNQLIQKQAPGARVLTASARGFIDEDNLVGLYYTAGGSDHGEIVLFRLSLKTMKVQALDRAKDNAIHNSLLIHSLSPDGKYIAYSHNGTADTRVVSTNGAKPIDVGARIVNFSWSKDAVVVKMQRNTLQHTDLKSRVHSLIELNPKSIKTISEEITKRDSHRIFKLENREFARINFPSVQVIGEHIVFLAEGSSHFCNTYLFSVKVNGGDINLLSDEVESETCGAIHMAVRDEKTLIYLNDDHPRDYPSFYETSVDGSSESQFLYAIE